MSDFCYRCWIYPRAQPVFGSLADVVSWMLSAFVDHGCTHDVTVVVSLDEYAVMANERPDCIRGDLWMTLPVLDVMLRIEPRPLPPRLAALPWLPGIRQIPVMESTGPRVIRIPPPASKEGE